MNIPDTINDARICALAEPYGKLIKVMLRPDHQGAIVEFADVGSAGKASLELEGHEIAPGRKVHVGTVGEMLKQRAEKKGVQRAPPREKPAALPPPTTIKRPSQPGQRGRRGGLGFKRGGGRAHNDTEAEQTGGNESSRSNDDFRAMMQRS